MQNVKISLRLKYSALTIFIIFTILIIIFLSVRFFIISLNRKTLSENFINNTITVIDFFSKTIDQGIRFEDDILLSQTLDNIKKLDNIEYVILFNNKKDIIFHSEIFSQQNVSAEDNSLLRSLFLKEKLTVSPEFSNKTIEDYYIISKSFYGENKIFYGMLLVKYSTESLKKLIQDSTLLLQQILVYIFLLSIILIIIFSTAFSYITVKPIEKITQSTIIIGNGNLDHIIELPRQDELGILARNFNAMVQKIKESQEAVIQQKINEKQLILASQIQQAIFPADGLNTPYLEIGSFTAQAREIGGDYHFYQQLNKDQVFFVIADISGKGIPAAMITFMFSIINNFIVNQYKYKNTGAIATMINHILSPNFNSFKKFASVLLGIYDQKSGKLNFTSCGHGPLYIYRQKTAKIDIIENRNIVIGYDKDKKFKSENAILKKNDTILLFTDGITDIKNRAGDSFGRNRTLDSFKRHGNLALNNMLKRVNQDIGDFTDSDVEQFDDMTILVLKRKK